MKVSLATAIIAAATAALVSGCASNTNHESSAQPATAHDARMTMADGRVMDRADMQSISRGGAAAAKPSASTAMICNAETHKAIAEVLRLPHSPTSSSSWADDVYTCTYRLAIGNLVVSTKQSHDATTARRYFAAARGRLAPTETLYGLGAAAYGNRAGIVVLVKDDDTLTVDARGLPAVFGPENSKRYDFAYQIASDILGCWTDG